MIYIYIVWTFSAYCEGELASSMSIDQVEHEQSFFLWMSHWYILHHPIRIFWLWKSWRICGRFSHIDGNKSYGCWLSIVEYVPHSSACMKKLLSSDQVPVNPNMSFCVLQFWWQLTPVFVGFLPRSPWCDPKEPDIHSPPVGKFVEPPWIFWENHGKSLGVLWTDPSGQLYNKI